MEDYPTATAASHNLLMVQAVRDLRARGLGPFREQSMMPGEQTPMDAQGQAVHRNLERMRLETAQDLDYLQTLQERNRRRTREVLDLDAS